MKYWKLPKGGAIFASTKCPVVGAVEVDPPNSDPVEEAIPAESPAAKKAGKKK